MTEPETDIPCIVISGLMGDGDGGLAMFARRYKGILIAHDANIDQYHGKKIGKVICHSYGVVNAMRICGIAFVDTLAVIDGVPRYELGSQFDDKVTFPVPPNVTRAVFILKKINCFPFSRGSGEPQLDQVVDIGGLPFTVHGRMPGDPQVISIIDMLMSAADAPSNNPSEKFV